MAKRKSPSDRKIAARGAILRKARIDADLTQELFAESAGVAIRTLSKAERGIAISPDCLARICKAHSLDYELIAVEPGAVAKPRTVRFKIEVEIDAFDPPPWIASLVRIIGAQHEITDPTVAPGSVLLTVKMHPDDLNRVCAAFHRGELRPLHVSSINFDAEVRAYQRFTRFRKIDLPNGYISIAISTDEPEDQQHGINQITARFVVSGVDDTVNIEAPDLRYRTSGEAFNAALWVLHSSWDKIVAKGKELGLHVGPLTIVPHNQDQVQDQEAEFLRFVASLN